MPCIAKRAEDDFFSFLNRFNSDQPRPWLDSEGREYLIRGNLNQGDTNIIAFIITEDTNKHKSVRHTPRARIARVGLIATTKRLFDAGEDEAWSLELSREVFMDYLPARGGLPYRFFTRWAPRGLGGQTGEWYQELAKCDGGWRSLSHLHHSFGIEPWGGDWRDALWLLFFGDSWHR